MLNHTGTIGVDAGCPVNHQVGDRWVKQKCAQLLGEEWQNEVVAHRGPPVWDCGSKDAPGALEPSAIGSTDIRFS
jgi:hypothetical protein